MSWSSLWLCQMMDYIIEKDIFVVIEGHYFSHPRFFYYSCLMVIYGYLQGDPNQNFWFQMTITQKLSTFDPMTKMRLRGGWFFLKIVNKQLKNVNKLLKIEKNCHLSNAFWLYQHRIRNAYFQSYSHLKSKILVWVTL